MTKRIPLSAIAIDGDTQSRVAIIDEAVNEYAASLQAGVQFEPVTVHFDGVRYWLSDGFHRYWAHKKLTHSVIDANVIEGTREDAQWYAAAANVAHGLRRSNADKRRAVEMALRVRGEQSDNAIAEHCQVSNHLVAEIRAMLTPPQVGKFQPEQKRVGRDGKVQSSTKRKTQPPPPPVEPPAAEPPRAHMPESMKRVDMPRATKPVPPVPSPNATPLYQDAVGRDIPAYLNEAWYARTELADTVRRLRDMRNSAEVRHEANDKVYGRIAATTFAAWKALEQALEDAMPYALCPICNGEGCDACKETGFVSELVWKHAIADEYKGGAQ